MKEKLSRLLSLVMTFIMLFGLMPTQALADAVVGEWVTGTGEIGTYAAIPNVISDASKISLRGDAFTVPVYYYDKDTSEILTSETFSVDDKDGVVVDKQLNSYTGKRGNAKLATVEEEAVEGYTTTYSPDTLAITNTIAQEQVTISGTKTWIDPEGTEHPAITINLLRDGVRIDSVTLENGETAYSFDDLAKYDLMDGHV